MPDSSPKPTRVAEDFTMALFRRGSNESNLQRSWWCPSDHTIAAYTDSVVGQHKRFWIEFHLARCQRCRLVVADTIKAQRQSDPPFPPAHLIAEARGLFGQRRLPWRWIWAPAGALAGLASLATLAVIFRTPEPLTILSPPVPPAPIIAKSELAPILRSPTHDIVRGRRTGELLPILLSPHHDSIIQSERLQFRWKPIPHSRTYEVRIVKADGDLVWEGETEESALQVPSDVAVKNGSYFVWITAFLENGRVAKSAPVQFQIKR